MSRAQPAAGLSVTLVEKSSAVGLNPAKARLPRCGGGCFLPTSADLPLKQKISYIFDFSCYISSTVLKNDWNT